jgi:UPF0176 protein
MNYRVLLYYKFVKIENPQETRDEHFNQCKSLELKGRILIASEGINGTLSGTVENTQAYMDWMQAHPLFHGIEFKVDESDVHTFLKLHVRVKPEVVNFKLPESVQQYGTATFVEPKQWREILKQAETDESIVILDTRSEYEYGVGKFKNAVTLDINNFRELPECRDQLEQLRGKKVYTYCTGGIRCEKITGWMEKEGFGEIYQLHGGIIQYGKEVGGEDFEGQCYVFDQRVVVPVNTVNPSVIGKCRICNADTEKMINCANALCNEHFLICESCFQEQEGCCSPSCKESPKRRAFTPQGYFLRGVNSKIYVNEEKH